MRTRASGMQVRADAKTRFRFRGTQPCCNAEQPLDQHLPPLSKLPSANTDTPSERKQQEVGRCHAVDCSREGDANAAANLIDAPQMVHYLDQAENGPKQTHGGRETAGRFKYSRRIFLPLQQPIRCVLQYGAKIRCCLVFRKQPQSVCEKYVRGLIRFAFEGKIALAPHSRAECLQLLDILTRSRG